MTSVGSTLELHWSFWIQHRACKVAKALWFCWRHQCEHVDSSYSSLLFVQKLAVSWWQYHHMPRSFQQGPPCPVHIVFKKAEKPECNVKPLWQYCAMLGHAQVSPMLFHQVIQFVLHEYALCFMILVSIRFALLCVALRCFALLCIALLYKLSYPSSYPPHYPCTCFSVVKSSQASRLVRKERGFGLILVGLVCYILYHWCELSQAVHAASFFPQPLRSVFGVRPEMGIDTKWQRQVKWVFRWMFLGNGRILQLIIFFFGKRTPEHRDQYGCRTAK